MMTPEQRAVGARAGILVGRRLVHRDGTVAVDTRMCSTITRIPVETLTRWRETGSPESPEWERWTHGPYGEIIAYPVAGLWTWCDEHGLLDGGDPR
jgi:hypothetical protein